MRTVGWDEYGQAIDYYEHLKTNFINQLNLIFKSEALTFEQELQSINTTLGENTADTLIQKIEEMIRTDPALKSIRRHVKKYKSQHHNATKESIRQYVSSLTSIYLSENWRQNLLQSINLGVAISDAALMGRLSQLLNMALRHSALNPGVWTKSQIDGLLYESALVQALDNYFSTIGISDWSDIVKVEGIGSRGGRGDVRIVFEANALNRIVQGAVPQDLIQSLQIQAKHFNLAQAFEDKKIKVGAGKRALKMTEYKGTPTAKATQRYLAKKDNIIAAIGKDVGIYSYSDQGLQFTSDFIMEAHQNQKLWLTMPNIAKGNYYIEWRAWISAKQKRSQALRKSKN